MRVRMASFSGLAVALVLILAGASPAGAQQVVKFGEGQTLTISGFISSTFFNDNGLFNGFGQGQNAEWAAPPAPLGTTIGQPGTDRSITDADVRNTRIRFEFAAQPVLGKWAPKAVLESDFFGAFNGAPPFGDEQPQMRIRFAYVDLTNGTTTVRIGQFWSPFFGETPVSLTHIAFPLGYGASGKIGWRFPGVFLYHDLTSGKSMNVQLQLAAMKGSGPIATGNTRDAAATSNIGNGEASGLPQLEALLNFSRKSGNLTWTGYVAGHLDWKDTTGTGVGGSNVSCWGVEVGDNLVAGSLTVHGNFYYGKGLGQQFAHITQQGDAAGAGQGRIRGWGAWAQAGYDFDPHWSFWVFAGMDQPDAQRFNQETGLTLARQLNHDYDALLRFRAGRYALGLEYFRAVTLWSNGPASADQYAVSVMYTL